MLVKQSELLACSINLILRECDMALNSLVKAGQVIGVGLVWIRDLGFKLYHICATNVAASLVIECFCVTSQIF